MSDHEAEDRTQAPSKQRRLLAREQGQVAQSKELTAAFGLLGASLVLWFRGQDLCLALLTAVRAPFVESRIEIADPSEVVSRLRHLGLDLARPCLMVLMGYVVAAFVAHQAQVRGLWATDLIAPDPSRLWRAGQGPGLVANASKGAWGILKTILIASLAAGAIRSEWTTLLGLSEMETATLAKASGQALVRLLVVLSLALFLLGLLDYALAHSRFEASLRTTPDQHRQETRSMDGDPSLRARRKQLAKAWRLDSGDVLRGASLMVEGASGLTIVLDGGPPPKPVRVRAIVVGSSADQLGAAAERDAFPTAKAPELARLIASRRPPNLPLPPELLAELAAIWVLKESR